MTDNSIYIINCQLVYDYDMYHIVICLQQLKVTAVRGYHDQDCLAKHAILRESSKATHRQKVRTLVGGFDEGTMAKIGQEMSGDEEFG